MPVSTHFTNLHVEGTTTLVQACTMLGPCSMASALKIASVTTAERLSYPAADGDMLYDTDIQKLYLYESGAWMEVGTSSSGGLVLSVAGTANQITSTGGTAPIIGLAFNPQVPGVEGIAVPSGTTGQRSLTPRTGDVRFNTTIIDAEVYTGAIWKTLGGVGTGTVTSVGVTTGSSGISLGGTNPVTTSGDISVDLNDDLNALVGLGNGFVVKTAANTYAPRTIFGTINTISITSGDGVSTDPIITIATDPVIPGVASIKIPAGTTGNRPGVPVAGMFRYNSDILAIEFYNGTTWVQNAGGTVTSVALGTASAGITLGGTNPVTTTGTINVDLDAGLNALVALGTGIVAKTAANTYSPRTILGTINTIAVTNGDGVATDPVLTIATNPIIPGTASVTIPSGTTGQRPGVPVTGMFRYNTTIGGTEFYNGSTWISDAGGTVTSVGVTTASGGITLGGTNPVTTTGNISVDLDADLNALAALSTTGMVSRTGAATYSPRTITGTASQILFTNGDGVSGNPTASLIATGVGAATYTFGNGSIALDATGRATSAASATNLVTSVTGTANQIASTGGTTPVISIVSNPIVPGTASITLTSGTTAQRPGVPVAGMFRYNTTIGSSEFYNGSAWVQTVTSVGITTTSGGITLGGTNPVTTSGNISVDLNAGLNALVALSTGMVAKTAANTYSPRTITGTTSQISLANGDGVSANPTISITSDPVIPGTASITIPSGTTAQRPGSPTSAMVRYNSDNFTPEFYNGSNWGNLSSASSVSSPTYNNQLANIIARNSGMSSSAPGSTKEMSAGHSETITLSSLNPLATLFRGAAFDGRYVYLCPHNFGTIVRFDTQASGSLVTTSNYSFFDATTVNSEAREFTGITFDGRYLYFSPGGRGFALRYDTTIPFSNSSSYAVFDVRTVNASAKGFEGAVFDGRYVYYVPFRVSGVDSGLIARFDTMAATGFSSTSSYAVFDMSTANASSKGCIGGAFDGRYIYFPAGSNNQGDAAVTRYDTTQSFTSTGSYSIRTLDSITSSDTTYTSAVYDGRNVYLFTRTATSLLGLIVKYDTKASTGFNSLSSYQVVDTQSINAGSIRFRGGVFDGKYIYTVPWGNVGTSGLVTRYDTTLPFTTSSSYTFFDSTVLSASSVGFEGGVYDGRFIYLASSESSQLTRIEAYSGEQIQQILPNIELDGISNLSTTGLIARTAAGTYAPRTIALGSTNLTISNPGGVSGNPLLDLATTLTGLTAVTATTITGSTTTVGGNITLSGNTISSTGSTTITTSSNGNVVITPNGTGDLRTDNLSFNGNTISILDTNGNLILTPNGTTGIVALSSASQAVPLRFYESGGIGNNYVAFKAGVLSTDTTWTLPLADSSGFFSSNGSGVMSITTAVTSVTAGSNLTGGTITGTGTIALDTNVTGLTSLSATTVTGTTTTVGGNISIAGNTLTATNSGGNVNLTPNAAGVVALTSTTAAVPLRFYESGGIGNNYVAFKAGTLTTDTTWTLPLSNPAAGGFLYSNGSSVMSITQANQASTIIVSKSGDNSTASRGGLPFLTIAGAIGASGITAGDTILVYPGTYTETSLILPDGVSMIGISQADCIISNTTSGTTVVMMGATSGAYTCLLANMTINSSLTTNAGTVLQFPVGTENSIASNLIISMTSTFAGALGGTKLGGISMIFISPNTGVVNVNNCRVTSTATSATATGDLSAIVVNSGSTSYFNIRNTTAIGTTGGGASGYGLRGFNSTSNINLYDCIVSGTTADTFTTTNANINLYNTLDSTSLSHFKSGIALDAGSLRFYNTALTQYVGFQAPALSATTTWTLPTADASGVFVSNGSAVMSVSATPTLTSLTAGTVTATSTLVGGALSMTGTTLISTTTNSDVTVTPNGTGGLALSGSVAIPLKFYEAGGPNFVALKAGSLSTDTTWTLPLLDSAGLFSSDGAGVMSITNTPTLTSLTAGTVTATTTLAGGNLSVTGNTIISTNTNGDVIVTPNGTGALSLASTTAAVPLKLYESGGIGNNFVALKAGVLAGDLTFTLPITDLTNGVMKSDGAGTLSLATTLSGLVSVGVGNFTLSSTTFGSSAGISVTANGQIGFSVTSGSNNIVLGTTGTTTGVNITRNMDAGGKLRFYNTGSTQYSAFQAPATLTTTQTWLLPSADKAGNFISDGSGNMSILEKVYGSIYLDANATSIATTSTPTEVTTLTWTLDSGSTNMTAATTYRLTNANSTVSPRNFLVSFNATIATTGAVTATDLIIELRKNGAAISKGTTASATPSLNNFASVGLTAIVSLANTDYLSIFASSTASRNVVISMANITARWM